MITATEILEALEKHTNVLLYGQPGTGKSHLMKEVQNLFEKKYSNANGSHLSVETAAERNAIGKLSATSAEHSRWVTFHQGYSYEDFIIGLRPKLSPAGTGSPIINLEPRAGALLELAAKSQKHPALLLIDEINRGNASRIFGEFITLMEADKRLDADGSPSEFTVSVTLPYIAPGENLEVAQGVSVGTQFSMPKRFYTLASMNSVDKSVAPLDAAIRRRFYIIHVRPTDLDLEDAAGVNGAQSTVAALAVNVLKKLNRGIGVYLSPDFMLGQYYLPAGPKLGEMSESDAKSRLVEIWRFKVVPQLMDLFQARPSVCMKLLRLDSLSGSGIEIISPTDEEADEGATDFVINNVDKTPDNDIFAFLTAFASNT